MTLEERFLKFVQKTDGCWLWTGAKQKPPSFPYGVISVAGRPRKAHRVSYKLFVGELSNEEDVLHKCDNPPCVRPDHLFKGDDSTNIRDAFSKGRITRKGSKNSRAKLTESQVLAIRIDPRSCYAIAKEYDIGKSAVLRIRHHQAWSHL